MPPDAGSHSAKRLKIEEDRLLSTTHTSPPALHLDSQQQQQQAESIDRSQTVHYKAIAPLGDLIIAAGRPGATGLRKAFRVHSFLLHNTSLLWGDKIRREARLVNSHASQVCRHLLTLPDECPLALEAFLAKIHHGKCTTEDAAEMTPETWTRLATLTRKYQCPSTIWFEADYWLRTNLTAWTLGMQTEQLWNGMFIAYLVDNNEWFGSYSKRLILLHEGSFADFGSQIGDRVLTLRLALALAEARSTFPRQGSQEEPKGLCLVCFRASETGPRLLDDECKQCQVEQERRRDRAAVNGFIRRTKGKRTEGGKSAPKLFNNEQASERQPEQDNKSKA